MASLITPPTNELGQIIRGDIDVLAGYDTTNNGFGTIHIRSGGLYVEGLTDLDQTTITTTDGKFHVLGSNKIEFNVSGGATSSIEMTAEDTSFFTTTAGTLTMSATATDANGKITVQAAGTGTDSILINSTNTTSGQVTIQCASADTTTDSIRLLASDTTGGNVLIQGSGNFATSVPAVRLYAPNATSGQILLESASDATGSDGILLSATGTTGGNVAIVGAGSNAPAVSLSATSATTGKILISSAGDSSGTDAIEILASGTTDGNIKIQANGGTTDTSITILADNNTTGKVLIQGDGNIADSVRITATNATAGGIDIDATGLIAIDTTSTSSGITIGTATAGVPVVIGTSTSLTTVAGDFLVSGMTTTINTETLTVEDNIVLINSGVGILGLDAGIISRRFQTANAGGTGDVVNSSATPTATVQESGAFQAGSSTPGTLVLAAHASDSDDFYNGWWIKVTSGSGNNQVRRIKDYVGSTKTATLYVTADNTVSFLDGLDLVTAPAAADTYRLYSDPYIITYFDEGTDRWTVGNTALLPAAGEGVTIQQYQEMDSGALNIKSQIYHNVSGSASGTTITFTLIDHELTTGDTVGISNSADFTPAITTGSYTVTSTPTANTFTITVGSSTTSAAGSSASVRDFNSSKLVVNVIESENGTPLIIPGLSVYEDIVIAKTSTTPAFLSITTNTSGSYLILVSDTSSGGAHSVFVGSRSSTSNSGTISRLSSARGAEGQRIDADWLDGEEVKIYHKPAGSGGGNYTYRVRVYSAI
jgi:hypothetical protein